MHKQYFINGSNQNTCLLAIQTFVQSRVEAPHLTSSCVNVCTCNYNTQNVSIQIFLEVHGDHNKVELPLHVSRSQQSHYIYLDRVNMLSNVKYRINVDLTNKMMHVAPFKAHQMMYIYYIWSLKISSSQVWSTMVYQSKNVFNKRISCCLQNIYNMPRRCFFPMRECDFIKE